jgi:hypothetical protein
LKTDIELDAPKTLEDVAALAQAYVRHDTVAIVLPAPPSHGSGHASTATTPGRTHFPKGACQGSPTGGDMHDLAYSGGDGVTPGRKPLLQLPRDIITSSPRDLPHEGYLPSRYPDEAEILLNALSRTCTGETMWLVGRLCAGLDTHFLGRLWLHPLLHGGSACAMPKPDSSQGWHDRRGGQR